jgi:hypothetical protein
MPGNRKAAEKVILEWMNQIDPSGVNTKQYEQFFANMDDKAFDAYIEAIEKEEDYVSVTMPNLGDTKITTENNLKLGEKLGINFFQRIWYTDPATGVTALTPQKYLVVELPVRRQIQTLVNKISIPEDNKHVDEMTDQPTGVSKGSSISFPEILVMYAAGHEKAIEEMIKVRGGDLKALQIMEKSIHETGGASLQVIGKAGTRVKSTETLAILMKGAHLDNNF